MVPGKPPPLTVLEAHLLSYRYGYQVRVPGTRYQALLIAAFL